MFNLSEITFGNVSLNEALDEFKSCGCGYAVISLVGYDESNEPIFSGEPFYRRDDAFKCAFETSKEGRWAYVIETFDHHVIVYLAGYCANP